MEYVTEQKKNNPARVRLYGRVIPAGTKNGKAYDAFVTFKVALPESKRKEDFHFTKDTDAHELVEAVQNGTATEFDVTLNDFWKLEDDKRVYPLYFGKGIAAVVAYKKAD